jgi:hypothetical protein
VYIADRRGEGMVKVGRKPGRTWRSSGKALYLKLPDEVYAALEEEGKATDRSATGVAADLLVEWERKKRRRAP